MNTATMSKKAKLEMIDKAYFAIERALESEHYGDRLFDMINKSEKQHRKFKPDGVTCGLTVRQAVKLFMVEYIMNGLYDPRWTIKDVMHIRYECVYAQSIAENRREKLLQALEGISYKEWSDNIDYAELNK